MAGSAALANTSLARLYWRVLDAFDHWCVFRSIAITDSSGRRSSNPVEGDHGFRSKAITHSSDRDQHGMTG
jgi:hypothetical protein